MRKFVLVAALITLAWIFLVPSCSSEFDCEAAGAIAHADDDECPSDVTEAAGDAEWAADRFATIADRKLTAGLFYDSKGSRHRVKSGKDSAADRANELLRELGRLPPGASAFTADHVEVKIAARMRDEDVESGVLVINHPGGPCAVVDGEPQPMSCQAFVPVLLPEGARLTVWWPQSGGSMASFTFTGGAA